MILRFHVLGLQHTASNRKHVSCAYTQKVVKLCKMLHSLGHHVIHYGNEGSDVVCDEHVQMCSEADLASQYGERWMTSQYEFNIDDPVYKKFDALAIGEIAKRKQPKDFLLCMWGHGHRRIADFHKDMIVVEPGIGYAGGHFAPYKVFESYALLHAYAGLKAVGSAGNISFYDVVIPNYFEPDDFTFSREKAGYVLFMGRIGDGKGANLIAQLKEAHPFELIMAGPGTPECLAPILRPDYIGFADYDKRRQLMAKARALLVPSMYVEPFGGVSIEAMFSGTPVISTDWGAFTENNLHGITGYRCRTLEQFIWALDNIHHIDPGACREWATRNFSCDRVAEMYDSFFHSIMDVHGKGGWAELHPERTSLDELTKYYPV
jgi:glycosyltransferase involved in cell wall biosynthesis